MTLFGNTLYSHFKKKPGNVKTCVTKAMAPLPYRTYATLLETEQSAVSSTTSEALRSDNRDVGPGLGGGGAQSTACSSLIGLLACLNPVLAPLAPGESIHAGKSRPVAPRSRESAAKSDGFTSPCERGAIMWLGLWTPARSIWPPASLSSP